jgi:hypothetical protein
MAKRWQAMIAYDDGLFEHEFDELHELHDIAEKGQNFYSIVSIVITINPSPDRKSYLEPGADPFEPIGMAADRVVDKLSREQPR